MTRLRAIAVALVLGLACAPVPAGRALPANEATQAHAALALAALSVRAVDDLSARWWASLRAPLVGDLAAYESTAGAVSEARVEIQAAYLEIDEGKPAAARLGKVAALMHRASADLARLGAHPPAELSHALAVVRSYSMGR